VLRNVMCLSLHDWYVKGCCKLYGLMVDSVSANCDASKFLIPGGSLDTVPRFMHSQINLTSNSS